MAESDLENEVESGFRQEERTAAEGPASEQRRNAVRILCPSLELSAEGEEAMSEALSDEEVIHLEPEIEKLTYTDSIRLVEKFLDELQRNSTDEAAAWIPANPQASYTLFERFASAVLRQVHREGAAAYEGRINLRLGKEHQSKVMQAVPERIGVYEAERERLIGLYCKAKSDVAKGTAAVFGIEQRIGFLEKGVEGMTSRLQAIDSEMQQVRYAKDGAGVQKAQERQNDLYLDRAKSEGEVRRLVSDGMSLHRQTQRSARALVEIQRKTRIVEFCLDQLYAAQDIASPVGAEIASGISAAEMAQDVALIKDVMDRGEKLNELYAAQDELAVQLPESGVMPGYGATPQVSAASDGASLTKLCNTFRRVVETHYRAG